MDSHTLQPQTLRSKKRTFTAEFLITDNIHNLFIHLIYIAKLLKSQKTQTGHHSSTHIAAATLQNYNRPATHPIP